MTEPEYLEMLDEVDRLLADPAEAGRLLDDPALLIDPVKISSLLADIFQHTGSWVEGIGNVAWSDSMRIRSPDGASSPARKQLGER